MAAKKIQLVFDLNSNDVNIATDRTLTLTQQVRIFKQELQKLPEGTREFEILRNKVNDTQDSLARVNTKSGEFFNTLSLIPGPIGDVSNQLDNSIGLLKTFSSFSLKDIGNQFKGLINDLAGVFDNLTGVNKAAKELGEGNTSLAQSAKQAADGINLSEAAALGNVVATTQQTDAIQKQTEQLLKQKQTIEDNIDVGLNQLDLSEKQFTAFGDQIMAGKQSVTLTKEQTEEWEKLNDQYIANLDNIVNLADEQEKVNTQLTELGVTQKQTTKETQKATIATEGQTAAETQNTGALAANTAAENTNTAAINTNTASEVKNTTTKKTGTVVTKLLATETRLQAAAAEQAALGNTVYAGTLRAVGVAAGAAATAIRVFKAVLISTGIGLLIVGLSELIAKVYEWVSASDDATSAADAQAAANEKLQKAQEAVRKSTQQSINTIEAETKAQITRAKIAGKTAEEIFRIEQNFLNKRIAVLEAANKKLKGAEQNYTDEIIKLRRDFAQNQLDFQLEQKKEREKNQQNELDAAIKLEIDSATTRKDVLKKLLDERLALELKELGNNENQKELARQEYAKKLEDAINADEKKRNDRKLKELDALAQLEIDKRDTDLKTLQSFYDQKLAIELQNEELSEAEKAALREKYSKLAQEAINKDIITRLQLELEANRGNYQEQLRIYAELQQELTKNLNLGEQERAQLIKQYQDALLSTLDLSYQNQVDKLNSQYDEFRRFDKEYFDGQKAAQTQYQADIDALKEKGAINDQEYLARSIKISKSRRELDLLERKTKQDTVSAIGDAFGNLSKIVGEDTKAGKAFAIAKTTIDTYSSAVAAYRSLAGIPVVGPVLGAIAAAAAVAAGIANVKKILAVQVPTDSGGTGGATAPSPPPPPIQVNAVKRSQGGLVSGYGGSQSDSIPAQLSNGEFVVNARSTKMFGGLLEQINSYGMLPQLSTQTIGSMSNNNMREGRDTFGDVIAEKLSERPIRTYVTATEISNQQQFDRVIRQRSLI